VKRHLGQWIRAALVCGVVALFLVGVAGADNSTFFPDPAGDAGSSLDITGLEVSNYEGYFNFLNFWVTLAGPVRCGGDGAGVQVLVALDLDQNPDTGSAFYGTEVEFAPYNTDEAQFFRAHGWDFRGAPPPEGFSWGCGPTGMGYSVNTAALGLSPSMGFNVVAAVLGPRIDTAPDIRTFNYQPVFGTPLPNPGPDTRAPHVNAFSTSAVHGKVAKLGYWALDGRGTTAETIRVYRRSRLLKTIRRPLGNSNPFDLSHVAWRVPSDARGWLRFSVRSVDAAGNKSTLSWASLAIH
jgi:hypothetical protein